MKILDYIFFSMSYSDAKKLYTLLCYLLIVNLLGFSSMGIDKKRAKAREWRIKERTLFFIAFIGGSLGSLLGMKVFHHKTKHRSFQILIPFFLILQITLGIIFIVKM